MSTLCHIELLGGLCLHQQDRVITRFSTQKTASLLAYLAYFRHQRHPREVLIEMLWPDCDPAAGRNRLSTALWSLRRLLEPPGIPAGTVLQASHFDVGLNASAVSTDVAEFLAAFRNAAHSQTPSDRRQHLINAVELYRGELLPGFYEEWALTAQRRLDGLYEQAQRFLTADARQADALETIASSLPSLETDSETQDAASLPMAFTRFIGREEELGRLQTLLSPLSSLSPRPRLITITGTGGIGKTRLALEAARRLLEAYAGAVWFVSLAELSDPRWISSALLEVLPLPRTNEREPMEEVIAFLQAHNAPALLVLDNFEQLVEGGAKIVRRLLEQAPTLTCLITSRRLLRLSAEREFALLPLPVPQREDQIERLSLYESVCLFIDRAQTARPDFMVTNRNAPAVAALCHDLEGIPLALELAAARSHVLTPEQMLSLMRKRFGFLVSKQQDVVERHQSLQAAIEWSYRLLSGELQRFICRLSVFRGGWTLEAAETICEEPMALDFLEHLRECSLILIEESETGMRYRMLETIREYAEEHLAAEETLPLWRRHRDFFRRLVASGETELRGEVTRNWLDALEREHENLQTALQRCKIQGDDTSAMLALAANLQRFWDLRCHYATGCYWLGEALACPEEPGQEVLRVMTLNGAGAMAARQGDLDAARRFFERGLAIVRQLGDKKGISGSLSNLGLLTWQQGDMQTARALLEESLAIAREIGEGPRIAHDVGILGEILAAQGELETARAAIQESLSLYRQVEDLIGIGASICVLAKIAIRQDQTAAASRYFQEALTIFHRMGNRLFVADTLYSLAEVALSQQQPFRAAQLLGISTGLWETLGAPRSPKDQGALESSLALLRDVLGAERFESAWETGQTMSLEQAVAFALEDPDTPAG